MKRILSATAALLLIAAPARADEGMWLLPLLQQMNSEAMTRIGCRLSADDIYSINHSSIKDAVCQFGGGCTGEIISDKGLLITNYHCGYGSIQALSTEEHNYLRDGFWAMSAGEELPVEGLTAKFLQKMTDVTAAVEKSKNRKKTVEEMVKCAEEENPGCRAEVINFYNDNVHYLIVYKIYRDVRFVGAPPSCTGKFGGDTDNWMWPRHTCDFSMFRVYAGTDNEPADYSADNIPYTPAQSLKVSLKGVQDGDFAMIMGYPGATQRFQTAAQLTNMLEVDGIRIAARTVRQSVLREAMESDELIRLKYANKYASSSNGWKKWIGMKQCFEKLGIITGQTAEEEAFTEWVDGDKARKAAYGKSIEGIRKCVGEYDAAEKATTLISESLWRIELLRFAARKNLDTRVYKDYDAALDRKVASAMMAFYLENVRSEDIIKVNGKPLDRDSGEALLDSLFSGSVFTDANAFEIARDNGDDLDKDPARVFGKLVFNKMMNFAKQMDKPYEDLRKHSKTFTAGLLEWKQGEASYPDANMTPRLTYGTVKSYSPKDGVLFKHYTTLDGVMEKYIPGDYEFDVPEKLREIHRNRDYGQYADKDGKLVTCFLTNCDITGGNSGSPVMNADGELIGLAFDGNWESMSSDVVFEPELQRCICVDIRYVLLIMDKLGGATYLLDEMNIVR